jgi:hypothetical protein
MVCSGLRNGIVPSVCSSVQALSKPSASARAMYARKRARSNSPSEMNWGMEIANRMSWLLSLRFKPLDVKHYLAAPLNVGDSFAEGDAPIGRCDRHSNRA